jgi:hypothetical protein
MTMLGYYYYREDPFEFAVSGQQQWTKELERKLINATQQRDLAHDLLMDSLQRLRMGKNRIDLIKRNPKLMRAKRTTMLLKEYKTNQLLMRDIKTYEKNYNKWSKILSDLSNKKKNSKPINKRGGGSGGGGSGGQKQRQAVPIALRK